MSLVPAPQNTPTRRGIPADAHDPFLAVAEQPASVFSNDLADRGLSRPTMPEYGPDLVGGVVSVEPDSFITHVCLHTGTYASAQYPCVSLLDSSSPQTSVNEREWERMKITKSVRLDLQL